MDVIGLGHDPGLILGPQFTESLEHRHEPRPLSLILRGEVGSPEERLQVRGQEHIERPTSTLSEHCLETRHVDLVHIRALFPVQFNADEMLVQEGGNLLVLKRLPLHHMAPMTG